MHHNIKELLTDEESAKFVPLWYWIEVAESVHIEVEFVKSLIGSLSSEDDISTDNGLFYIYNVDPINWE
jgi:hypothetical protein